MGSTQPNPIHVGWVGFFLTHHRGWVEKSPQSDPTQPMHTLKSTLESTIMMDIETENS